METLYLSINMEKTGNKIKTLLKEQGITTEQVKVACGFEYTQAIYKWYRGQSLPSLENLIILSRILHTSIESMLVVEVNG
ncbi:MAG: helix-turn-helix transcriptional regulator [Lachnospiraceae bacterium]|nr:helix-turn-helix transcriptional regulator [Lachnospiraceae bacterium]